MTFMILFLTALLISSIGYYKFVYFISLGYGFSVAGLGAVMLFVFRNQISFGTAILCILLIIYGCRLGGYLLLREIKSAAYRNTMQTEIKDGSKMKFVAKFFIWISCALLYVLQVSPIFFRLDCKAETDACAVIGIIVMASGMLLEACSDFQKSKAKAKNPKRFCDTGLFKLVRCPNYFGEILTWTGVFISGITALDGVLQWIAAVFGYIAIVYIMFGGARRLELRQNKNYGDDTEYQAYVNKTPILLPFVPLYSVAKYKFLIG